MQNELLKKFNIFVRRDMQKRLGLIDTFFFPAKKKVSISPAGPLAVIGSRKKYGTGHLSCSQPVMQPREEVCPAEDPPVPPPRATVWTLAPPPHSPCRRQHRLTPRTPSILGR
jgi:hypothetical protein